jgi:basic membrane lipoprotein Med (substrate-binding protein (PBP1-ABC) superfamily)
MQVMRAGLGWMVVGMIGLLLVACTDEPPEEPPTPTAPEPSEPPASPLGTSVGVVLPSDDEVDPAVQGVLKRDVERLAVWAGEDVREMRAYRADSVAFAADLAQLRAERGDDLVCVLGRHGPEVAAALRERYSDVSFCAVAVGSPEDGTDPVDPTASDAADDPGTPDVVELRVEELGHVIGVTARLAADEGTVGVLLGGDELPADAFRTGLLAGLTGVDVVDAAEVVEITDEDEPPTAADAARALVEEGVEVLVVDGSVGAVEALETVDDDVLVLAPVAVVEEADAQDGAVATWRVRWDRILQAPVAALLEGEDEIDGRLGFAEEVFEVDVGPGGDTGIADAVDDVVERFVAGERDAATPGQQADPGDQDGTDEAGSGTDAG